MNCLLDIKKDMDTEIVQNDIGSLFSVIARQIHEYNIKSSQNDYLFCFEITDDAQPEGCRPFRAIFKISTTEGKKNTPYEGEKVFKNNNSNWCFNPYKILRHIMTDEGLEPIELSILFVDYIEIIFRCSILDHIYLIMFSINDYNQVIVNTTFVGTENDTYKKILNFNIKKLNVVNQYIEK
tara:strand:+ start:1513 stop:2055 length:543 start_codon:yes stop_codon:yes gene_type:complete